MIRIYGTALAGLLGLAFGSFLNVCLSRWPRGMSVVKPRSYCENCGRTLSWWENVPLLSWIALRGRCRTCRVWIGWRTLLVELAVGGIWAFLISTRVDELFLPNSPNISTWNLLIFLILRMAFFWLLVALAALDAEHLWLPDEVTLPGIALGIIATLYRFALPWDIEHSPLWRPTEGTAVWHHLILETVLKLFIGILLAPTIILLIRWIYWLIRRREGIGLGDAKLMAMLAAWLGFSGALLSFGIGVVLGAFVALAMLAIRQKTHQAEGWAITKLPLGTSLCIGGIISGLWGNQIIDAYLRWAGF